MLFFKRYALLQVLLCIVHVSSASEDINQLEKRGKALFFQQASCWVCHGKNAEGIIGPSLQYGPSPTTIQQKLTTVPQMGGINAELQPNFDDLIALSVFINTLGEQQSNEKKIATWRTELAEFQLKKVKRAEIPLSPRDKKILEIQNFNTALTDWQRHAKTGSLKRHYQVKQIASYEASETVFKPEANKLYFYENTGTRAGRAPSSGNKATSSQIVIGDAATKKVITSKALPKELRGAVHTTVLSPDGRYVYIVGPSSKGAEYLMGSVLRSSATLLKVDALTLQPIKQLVVGGRVHHAQIFQDKFILIDTFNSDPGGLDVFLFDPETDEIIGGVNADDLGGSIYTAFTDDEFIYLLMQPGNQGGVLVAAQRVASGQHVTDLPYWVAKIDPNTWEVKAEYPFPGFRGSWIAIDSKKEYLYVTAGGSSNVTKINNTTGAIEWSSATGTGPYGATLTADETELWVSNKGEGTGMLGRTITVLNTATGRPIDTLFSGYQSDHVLLSPNGKEMWVTSNGEGRIHVFDAVTREKLNVIDMPDFGDPHGLVWVKYDNEGKAKVVRDQGGFHHGIHPSKGRPLLD